MNSGVFLISVATGAAMGVDSWRDEQRRPLSRTEDQYLQLSVLTSMPYEKIFTQRSFLGVEIPCHPSAQGIQIPCLPFPPSISVAAQTVDLKNFSPLLGVAGAPVFPAARETQGSGDRRRPSQTEKAMPQFE
jgi:hypothetical protein